MEEAEKGESFQRNTKSRLDSHPGATAGLFTDDLILEILSRLPARSVHRFKCLCVHWRDLIADPANRKKMPQTLAGFLYRTYNFGERCGRHHFASVSGGAALFDPCLPWLSANKYKDMSQMDACNGLLLYSGRNKEMASWAEDDFRFVVCNPVTGRWVEVPPQPPAPENRCNRMAGLAFDPAVSSHFHVIHFEETCQEPYMTGVCIYSSRTGAWSRMDNGMAMKGELFFLIKCVFVGGTMYMIGNLDHMNGEYVLVGVDMEGKLWKTIRVPYGSRFGTIGSSQGCLNYAAASVLSIDDKNEILVSEITLWCLKDHDSKELVVKHTASIDKLMSMTRKKYRVVEIHPDCDTIFLVSYGGDTLAAYDMQHQKVGSILSLEKNITQWKRFLPYVPLFSESLAAADGQ